MIQAQEASGKHLFIVKQNRFNPPVAAVKNAIDAGRLGRIIDVQLNCFWNRDAGYYRQSDWKGRKELDGGILFTQFSHFIDLLYWMFGEVRTVQVLTRNFLHRDTIEFDDTGVVILEFASGALGTINFTINSHQKNFEGSLTIFGEKGTIKIGGQYLNVLEYQNVENFAITDLPASRPANDYGFYQGSMSNHDQVFLNVVNVLRHGAAIATTAWEGLKTVEIIERIHARANQPDVS
jgi:predicted dehydrogenase